MGLPESVIDPATSAYPNLADRTYTTAYDAAGEPVTVTEPGGVVNTSSYNAAGDLTTQTGTGGEAPTPTRTLGYDADGRITSETSAAGTETYSYEDRGGLWSESGPMGTASYTYDRDGQVATKTDNTGTTGYTYDLAGELQTLADPQTGDTLAYGYYPTGDLESVNYGTGGATQSFTYNTQHDLTGNTLKSATGTIEASLSYGYTPAGQISTETSTGIAGSSSSSYSYDQAGRLTNWTDNGSATSYGYDDNGNLTSRGSTTASYNARNQLTAAGNTDYAYTARGTLASTTTGGTATTTSAYNAFDQLVTQGAQSYTYDSLGRLATSNASTFSYDDTTDNMVSDGTESFTRAPDGALTSIGASGSAVFAYSDARGDLLGTFTGTGSSLAGSTAYDPWGSPIASAGTSSDIGYQGGWTDSATGQVNTASRWYNPGTADFTSRDTAPLNPTTSASGNLYAYADDNPMANADPSGNSPVICGAGANVPSGAGSPGSPSPISTTSMGDGGSYSQYLEYTEGGGSLGQEYLPSPFANYDWSMYDLEANMQDLMGGGGSSDGFMGDMEGGATGAAGFALYFAVRGSPYVLAAGSDSCVSHQPPPPPPINWHTQKPKSCSDSSDHCHSVAENGDENKYEIGKTRSGVNIGNQNLLLDPFADGAAPQYGLLLDPTAVQIAYNPKLDDDEGKDGCQEGSTSWVYYQPLDKYGRATGVQACLNAGSINYFPSGRTKDWDDGKDTFIIGSDTARGKNAVDPPGYESGKGLARGHLLGYQLGGSGTEVRNLVPEYTVPNSVIQLKYENEIASHVAAGETVYYTSHPVYDGTNPIPLEILITAISSSGWHETYPVKNVP